MGLTVGCRARRCRGGDRSRWCRRGDGWLHGTSGWRARSRGGRRRGRRRRWWDRRWPRLLAARQMRWVLAWSELVGRRRWATSFEATSAELRRWSWPGQSAGPASWRVGWAVVGSGLAVGPPAADGAHAGATDLAVLAKGLVVAVTAAAMHSAAEWPPAARTRLLNVATAAVQRSVACRPGRAAQRAGRTARAGSRWRLGWALPAPQAGFVAGIAGGWPAAE